MVLHVGELVPSELVQGQPGVLILIKLVQLVALQPESAAY